MTETCTTVSFDEVLTGGRRWQRWLVSQWHGLIPDIDAEITACVWERFQAGVTDQAVLFSAARTALRRVSRREQAAYRAGVAAIGRHRTVGEDPYERIAERVTAAAITARLEIPPRARAWVTVMSVGGRATPQAMEAGRRWANRVRPTLTTDRTQP